MAHIKSNFKKVNSSPKQSCITKTNFLETFHLPSRTFFRLVYLTYFVYVFFMWRRFKLSATWRAFDVMVRIINGPSSYGFSFCWTGSWLSLTLVTLVAISSVDRCRDSQMFGKCWLLLVICCRPNLSWNDWEHI